MIHPAGTRAVQERECLGLSARLLGQLQKRQANAEPVKDSTRLGAAGEGSERENQASSATESRLS